MWVPVAVWLPCELLYTCYLLTVTCYYQHDQYARHANLWSAPRFTACGNRKGFENLFREDRLCGRCSNRQWNQSPPKQWRSVERHQRADESVRLLHAIKCGRYAGRMVDGRVNDAPTAWSARWIDSMHGGGGGVNKTGAVNDRRTRHRKCRTSRSRALLADTSSAANHQWCIGGGYTLEHSNSRFESNRFDSLCESIRIDSFCKKIGFSIH